MLNIISGKDNRTLKLIRSLNTRSGRKKHGLYFVEGLRIVADTIEISADSVEFLVFSQSFSAENSPAVSKYASDFICYQVSDSLFEGISDTKTPQGILAALKHSPSSLSEFSDDSKILILAGIQDPGNMGTIIRTAEAMGISSLFLTKGCVDIYSPKVLRSAMGSALRTRFYNIEGIEDILWLKKRGYTLFSAALKETSIQLNEALSAPKTALVIGNEANGISDEILSISDYIIKIPMSGKIESLNAAVAASIIMYHFTIN